MASHSPGQVASRKGASACTSLTRTGWWCKTAPAPAGTAAGTGLWQVPTAGAAGRWKGQTRGQSSESGSSLPARRQGFNRPLRGLSYPLLAEEDRTERDLRPQKWQESDSPPSGRLPSFPWAPLPPEGSRWHGSGCAGTQGDTVRGEGADWPPGEGWRGAAGRRAPRPAERAADGQQPWAGPRHCEGRGHALESPRDPKMAAAEPVHRLGGAPPLLDGPERAGPRTAARGRRGTAAPGGSPAPRRSGTRRRAGPSRCPPTSPPRPAPPHLWIWGRWADRAPGSARASPEPRRPPSRSLAPAGGGVGGGRRSGRRRRRGGSGRPGGGGAAPSRWAGGRARSGSARGCGCCRWGARCRLEYPRSPPSPRHWLQARPATPPLRGHGGGSGGGGPPCAHAPAHSSRPAAARLPRRRLERGPAARPSQAPPAGAAGGEREEGTPPKHTHRAQAAGVRRGSAGEWRSHWLGALGRCDAAGELPLPACCAAAGRGACWEL